MWLHHLYKDGIHIHWDICMCFGKYMYILLQIMNLENSPRSPILPSSVATSDYKNVLLKLPLELMCVNTLVTEDQ